MNSINFSDVAVDEDTVIEWLSLGKASELFTSVMYVDAFWLKRRWQTIQRESNASKGIRFNQHKQWAPFIKRLLRSLHRCQSRVQQRPQVEYPDLPVSQEKEAIQAAIAAHQVVIIAGETGSGKTTQIPKMCLELGLGTKGLIAHTQPRRLAARSVATRIADELESTIGEHVGFKIRFSDNVSDSSYIKLMTDGMLLAEMQNDRFLNQYDTIIIDEAHERSLNIDFLLGYLKQLLPKRPELKVIITSATIDPMRFSKHFGNAPIIEVSGRTYPVEIRYRDETENDNDMLDNIVDAVDELMREPPGDILIFLSGERDIRDAEEVLNRQQYRNTELVPLYARLSASEQNKIFQSHAGRRIVLATNVAETSLTVPGIKYVIDPGMARLSRYSARSKVQRLPIEPISQASANQRAGRCGRTSEGICIRLYSEEDYLGRPEFTDPEILRTNLASVILQMLSLGLGDIERFPFVQAPDSRNINDGFLLLEELQAISSRANPKLTSLGRNLAAFPIDPRYARMVLAAGSFDAVYEVMVIAAGLSIQDPRERPQNMRQKADEAHKQHADDASDFIALLNLFTTFKQQQKALSGNQLRKWCKTQFINYLRMREWQDIVSQIKHALVSVDLRINSQPADYEAIHQSIVTGLLSHIGQLDKNRQYKGARNAQFMIFPGSGIANKTPKWVMAAELVETSRLFARVVAKINPEWLEPLAPHLVKSSYSEPHWSKKRGSVTAIQRVSLFGLPIVTNRRVNYSNIDPAVCYELFIREALVQGHCNIQYAFLRHNQSLLEDIELLEQKTRRRDLLVSEDELVDFYRQHIPNHVVSEASFKKWYRTLDDNQIEALKFSREHISNTKVLTTNTEYLFPEFWRQGDIVLPLSYQFEPTADDDGVSLLIPLPLLNQLQNVGFDWLVPGLQHELIVALIKSLPKRLRRHFVPAPDYAKACQNALQDERDNQPLLAALSQQLLKMSGVQLNLDDFDVSTLPRHLRMHFKVVNEHNKIIASNDDLVALKNQLQGQVQETLNEAATPEFERSGLNTWDFEQLPEKFSRKTGQFEVQAYPALVPGEQGIDIRLFDTQNLANEAHQRGITELVKLVIPSPIKHLQQKLPNKAKLGLYFNPFGSIAALIDDCVTAAVDAIAIRKFETHENIRSKAQFNELCEAARANVNDDVLAIATELEKGLVVAANIQKQLKGKVDFSLVHALGDVKAHLNQLVFPGFVSDLGVARLGDWQRYVKALANRIEKLKVDVNRDRLNMLQIDKVSQAYEKLLSEFKKQREIPTELLETRWMIEELRVSLFAQQLGTKYPISVKRIENHLREFSH
ncbi:ATP-dependent RNA helicase HrpA [Alteromonas arenosi]|uniref:ATP-dependent RNA helicase HrpA n=1 Tax=Alteromonas arenosi TaxID=3055817 RepID=UPI003DA6EF72